MMILAALIIGLIFRAGEPRRENCACSCVVAEDSTADRKVPRSMALVQPMSFTMSPCDPRAAVNIINNMTAMKRTLQMTSMWAAPKTEQVSRRATHLHGDHHAAEGRELVRAEAY